MKIAVYTIVKNAEQYIDSWYRSAQDADLLILGDTGSTDDTIRVARKLGILVYKIKPEAPFHFGNARNAILKKIPNYIDVCVSLDADEVLVDGWRNILEEEWDGRNLAVKWVWGHMELFIPRIHPRHGVQWHDRIHEYVDTPDRKISKITILHNKDVDRGRDFYIDLLEQQYNEQHDQRSRAYLGIELAARGRKDEALPYLVEYLNNEITFSNEAASVCNVLYSITNDPQYLYTSIFFAKKQKEAYGRIAIEAIRGQEWAHAYHMIKLAIENAKMPAGMDWAIGNEAEITILAESAFMTGRHEEAVYYGEYLTSEYGGQGHVDNLKRYMGELYDPLFDKYKYRNWFQAALPAFKHNMHIFDDRPIRGLQIGAYTGLSSIWIVNNMNCVLTDVDTWRGSDEEEHHDLDWEDVYNVYKDRTANATVNHFRTTSDEFFASNTDTYDFIYIDGDHTRAQVYKDAVNADKCLRTGGVIAFDDYEWGRGLDDDLRPKLAIDDFIKNYNNYTIIYKKEQVWLRKL